MLANCFLRCSPAAELTALCQPSHPQVERTRQREEFEGWGVSLSTSFQQSLPLFLADGEDMVVASRHGGGSGAGGRRPSFSLVAEVLFHMRLGPSRSSLRSEVRILPLLTLARCRSDWLWDQLFGLAEESRPWSARTVGRSSPDFPHIVRWWPCSSLAYRVVIISLSYGVAEWRRSAKKVGVRDESGVSRNR